jgi:hypothetical protein
LTARGARASAVRYDHEKIRGAESPYVIGVFDESRKFLRGGARSRRATRCTHRLRSPGRNMWCRRPREHASFSENAGFFVAL